MQGDTCRGLNAWGYMQSEKRATCRGYMPGVKCRGPQAIGLLPYTKSSIVVYAQHNYRVLSAIPYVFDMLHCSVLI